MKASIALYIVSALLFGIESGKAEQMTITAECVTDPTEADGIRHACDSNPSIGKAPPGFVFNQNQMSVSVSSNATGEHYCRSGWTNFVEVLPGSGITQPTTFALSAHALGPSGHWAGPGWVKCTALLGLAKYK